MENKIYVVYNYYGSDQPKYTFESEADAEEFLLSIAEEEDYRRFCIAGPDEYFSSLEFHKDMNSMDIKNASLAGYALWAAGYTYDIIETTSK